MKNTSRDQLLQKAYSILESMFCTCCGAQVKISFAFCPSCGESLRNDRQASTDRGGSTCAENVIIEISGNRIALASVHPLLAWIRADQKFYLRLKGQSFQHMHNLEQKSGKKDGGISNRRCQDMEIPKLFINLNLDDIVQLKFTDYVFVRINTFTSCQKTTAF